MSVKKQHRGQMEPCTLRERDLGMKKGGRELTKTVVKESSCGRPYSSLAGGEALAVKELNRVVC